MKYVRTPEHEMIEFGCKRLLFGVKSTKGVIATGIEAIRDLASGRMPNGGRFSYTDAARLACCELAWATRKHGDVFNSLFVACETFDLPYEKILETMQADIDLCRAIYIDKTYGQTEAEKDPTRRECSGHQNEANPAAPDQSATAGHSSTTATVDGFLFSEAMP